MSIRELSPLETAKRVQTLDALYLNADRRRAEWQALDPQSDIDQWRRAYGRWIRAKREYERVRDLPYRLAAVPAADAQEDADD